MPNVGPQYQSQLALLAGALGHGLDAQTGYSIYSDTLAQAQAAQQAKKEQIQQTLASLAQVAQDQATAGATPDQVGQLVRSAAAGLPRSDSNAVHQGIHGILGHLADYTPTVDPMDAAQLKGQLLQNAKLKNDLLTGGLDVSQETVFGPAHQQEVVQLTQQYQTQGMNPQAIRSLIRDQMSQEFSYDVTDPKTGTKSTVFPTGLDQAVQSTISATLAQSNQPLAGTGGLTGSQWAQSNLQKYSPTDLTPASGGPPPPTPPSSNFAQQALSPSQSGGTWSSLADWTAGGAAAGGAAGLIGGPLAPVTVPAGLATGAGVGFLGGLLHHFLS